MIYLIFTYKYFFGFCQINSLLFTFDRLETGLRAVELEISAETGQQPGQRPAVAKPHAGIPSPEPLALASKTWRIDLSVSKNEKHEGLWGTSKEDRDRGDGDGIPATESNRLNEWTEERSPRVKEDSCEATGERSSPHWPKVIPWGWACSADWRLVRELAPAQTNRRGFGENLRIPKGSTTNKPAEGSRAPGLCPAYSTVEGRKSEAMTTWDSTVRNTPSEARRQNSTNNSRFHKTGCLEGKYCTILEKSNTEMNRNKVLLEIQQFQDETI